MNDDELLYGDHEKREKQEEAEREKRYAETKMHLGNLLDNPSGRWLMRMIISTDYPLHLHAPTGNSWDMYFAGREYTAKFLMRNISAAFGHAALDKILEEK